MKSLVLVLIVTIVTYPFILVCTRNKQRRKLISSLKLYSSLMLLFVGWLVLKHGYCNNWIHNLPCYKNTSYPRLSGTVLDDLFGKAIQEGCDLLCTLDYHNIINDHFLGSISSGGLIFFPKTSTTEALKTLRDAIKCVESWL